MSKPEKRKTEPKKSLANTGSVSKPANVSQPAKPTSTPKPADAKNTPSDSMHDYLEATSDPSQHVLMEEVFPSLPITPWASPAGKLRKVMDTEASTVLSQLSSLTKLRSDTLEKMVSGNSIVISEIKKAVQENTEHITAVRESFDAVCAEINDMKDRVSNMETQVEKCQTNAEAQERYSRRWNLKLYGLAEKEKQDVRQEVIQVCQSVLPNRKR